MGYIHDLRKIEGVGHRPLLMVTGGVFLFNSENAVLLERRRDDHTWCVPAGSMELGETPEDAARRELLEETGISAGELTLISVLSGERCHFTYPNGDEVYCVDFNFLCRSFSGHLVSQKEEVCELRFFPVSALPHDLNANDHQVIRQILAEHLLD